MKLSDYWRLYRVNVGTESRQEVAAFHCGAAAALMATDTDAAVNRFFARNEQQLAKSTKVIEEQARDRVEEIVAEMQRRPTNGS